MELDHTVLIYIISGPCGVGKSTVSHGLAQKYSLSSHINADNLYHMVVGGYIPPWEDNGTCRRLLWANINSIIENSIINGFIAVVDYVVFPEDLSFIEEIKNKYGLKVKYVVLMADGDTIRGRDSSRTIDSRMGERAIELLEEFKEKQIDNRFIINTSSKSIDDTISIIINDDRFLI